MFNEQYNINESTPPDFLHHIKLGIFKYIIDATIELIKKLNTNDIFLMNQLDNRIKKFNINPSWNSKLLFNF